MIAPLSFQLEVIQYDPLYWKARVSLLSRAVDWREKHPRRVFYSVQDLVAINKLRDDDFDTLWANS